MMTKVFSVYDSKAQVFNVPFYQVNAAMAIRAFSDLVNDERSGLPCKHPGDFVLYELGEFDDTTGTLKNYSEHKHLGIGSQYKLDKTMVPQVVGLPVREMAVNGKEDN